MLIPISVPIRGFEESTDSIEWIANRKCGTQRRYCSCHSNIKFISSRHRVISTVYLPIAPPKIFQPRSPINVLSGSWTELPCNVSGNPKPTVSWFLYDLPIDVSDPKYLILPSGNLRIFGVTPSDSGVYSCMASNPLGVARRPVELSVQGKNSLKMIKGIYQALRTA